VGDAHAGVETETEHVQDEQHLAPRERRLRVEVRLDQPRVRERVVAAESAGDLEAAARLDVARSLGGERLPVVVALPAGAGDIVGVIVERPAAQRREARVDVARAEAEVSEPHRRPRGAA
jgi:hypothetical protein